MRVIYAAGMEQDHEVLATLDLGDGWRVGVCTCGWASPNVQV